MKIKLLLCMLLFSSLLSVKALAEEALYELRVYQPQPNRQSDLVSFIGEDGMRFAKKHKLDLIAAWTPVDPMDERVVTLVRHADRKSCDANWAEFQDDPEWKQTAAERFASTGSPVASLTRIFLNESDYSPKLEVKSEGDRVFELRTYIATPNNLGRLNDRFRNHTMELFQKHGITNIVYWGMAPGETLMATELLSAVSPVGKSAADITKDLPAANNALVYFIAHASPEAAKASFSAFGQDPDWTKARVASEEGAGGSLTAGNAVKSLFLKPAPFSPIQ